MTACPPPGFTCRHQPPGRLGTLRSPRATVSLCLQNWSLGWQPCWETCGARAQPDLHTALPRPACWEGPHSPGPLGRAVGASSWSPWPPAPPGGPRAASSQTRSREVPPEGKMAGARRRTPRPVQAAHRGPAGTAVITNPLPFPSPLERRQRAGTQHPATPRQRPKPLKGQRERGEDDQLSVKTFLIVKGSAD